VCGEGHVCTAIVVFVIIHYIVPVHNFLIQSCCVNENEKAMYTHQMKTAVVGKQKGQWIQPPPLLVGSALEKVEQALDLG